MDEALECALPHLDPVVGGISRTLLLAAAVIYGSPLLAASSTSSLNVSVEVVARTIVTLDRAPASVQITSEDAARGYVDIPQAVFFRVRTNASNGYALEFEPVHYPFTRAEIRWANSGATVGSDGAWIAHAYESGLTTGSLDVRLILAPGVAAGSYSWPLQFDAISR